MRNEGDLIASGLLNDYREEQEREDELLLDDGYLALLEGLKESEFKPELFSQEDMAWVDSCLVADPELSLESWNSLKEALIDSITSFDDFHENNATFHHLDEAGNGEQMAVDEEEVPTKPEIVSDQEDAANVPALVNRAEGYGRDVGDGHEEILKEIESTETIFMVWNLREEQDEKEHELIPELKRAVADLLVAKEEEDQFLADLNQALAESILRDKLREGAEEASTAEAAELDKLISSLGDLSLKPSSK
ncbi:uncharacterized protein LOC110026582 [Phalaenopsis equestris]|uniref:uncharacterized protein LOC110026582 n=1 Tax=Phalaenopsis equestris TaxID=78828 RepID=UPI0009E48FA2|nr:uncharacterized protein LOC110026582 [Phalaenopsis equestris]XP_020583235.1 uncharacterized protein LOC110026582 [Phalaenopsis equestris]